MFPYPSGAGLHVGHPEGYTATDILARYRRALGCNVLHPMGWDAFGLPAEQYAIRTGQHPRQTTEANIAVFKRQIKALGFSYDWSREIDTTDPGYFKWTQWIFLQLYNSWFNPASNKAEPIETLPDPPGNPSPEARRRHRDNHRLAYVTEAPVWWCEQLGTVLANEEVVDGKSEVGGFPVMRRPMRQWMLRITAYAERLLEGLEQIQWSDSLKEMQRNWIGRSEGAEVEFPIADFGLTGDRERDGDQRSAFSPRGPTRCLARLTWCFRPEHKLVESITTPEQQQAVADYQAYAAGKSDLERTELRQGKNRRLHRRLRHQSCQSMKKSRSGLPTTSWPPTAPAPSWPCRRMTRAIWNLPRKFNLPIVRGRPAARPESRIGRFRGGRNLSVNSTGPISSPACRRPSQEGKSPPGWRKRALAAKTVNYKLRDWLFSRQRYWGEPFPIVWKRDRAGNLCHEALPESALPVLPPELTDFKPTATGEPPLARAKDWVNLPDGSTRETNTMPQWAGSCWYYLRFTDPAYDRAICGKEAENYWMGTSPNPNLHLNRNPNPVAAVYDRRHPPPTPRRYRNPPPASTSTSAASSTPSCICSTRGSGTKFCLTWAASPPLSRFTNWSTRA